jgi:hypothetical protein
MVDKMKNKRNKIIIGAAFAAIFSIYILVPLSLYINYTSREVYVKEANGDLIAKSGIVYEYDGQSFYHDVKKEKVIGRLEGSKFFDFGGTLIWKLEGYEEQDVIYETALMWQAAYKRKQEK